MIKRAINFGCGYKIRPSDDNFSWLNIDKHKYSPEVFVMDFDKEDLKLLFEDNLVEMIEVSHVLEHVKNIIPFMNECYRILAPGGQMLIKVPQGIGTWADPTHVRAFSEISFRYYCGYAFDESYGINCKFKEITKYIVPNQDGGELVVVLQK